MRALVLALLWLAMPALQAAPQATVDLCFNYGCLGSSAVAFDEGRLAVIGAKLGRAEDPAGERLALAEAVGALYRMAGEQAPISADRAGNYLDEGVHGRMDCIDHSTNTTRFLALLAARGWLRHHRLLAPVRRTRFFLMQHFSAAVEEIGSVSTPAPAARSAKAALSPATCDCDNALPYEPASDDAPASDETAARYVIDSWFVEHGEAAVVLPLEDWLKGEGPNVQ